MKVRQYLKHPAQIDFVSVSKDGKIYEVLLVKFGGVYMLSEYDTNICIEFMDANKAIEEMLKHGMTIPDATNVFEIMKKILAEGEGMLYEGRK